MSGLGTLLLKGLEGPESLTEEEQRRLRQLGDRLSTLENLSADIQPSLGGIGRVDVGNVRINRGGAFIRSGEIRMGSNVAKGPYWIGDPIGIRFYQKTNLLADQEAAVRWFDIAYGDSPGDELGTLFTYLNSSANTGWMSVAAGCNEDYDSSHNNAIIELAAITKSSRLSNPNAYMGSTWVYWYSYYNASSQTDFGLASAHRYHEVFYGNGVSYPVTFSLGYDYTNSHQFAVTYGSHWLNNLSNPAPSPATGYGQIYVYGGNLYYKYQTSAAVQLDVGGSSLVTFVYAHAKTDSYTNSTAWFTLWEYTIAAGTLDANGWLLMESLNYVVANVTSTMKIRYEIYDGTTTTYYPNSTGVSDSVAPSTNDRPYHLTLLFQNLGNVSQNNANMWITQDFDYTISSGAMTWATATKNVRIRLEMKMDSASTSFHLDPRFMRVSKGTDS